MKSYAIILLLLIFSAACRSNESSTPANGSSPAASIPAATTNSGSSATNPAPPIKARIEVCNLLTTDDLKSVQGEAYNDAKRSDRQDGDLVVAQCYYTLPTIANSVVLNVTTAREGSGARSPRDFWQQTFRADEGKSKKDKSGKRREGEEKEEESGPPERVRGLGDEAFWTASRVGGALYVLKNDQYFRISVGGAGDTKSKLNKSKALAKHVLKRL